MMNQSKKNTVIATLDSTVISLPAPATITFMWNFGSLLAVCLMLQIITGVLMASAYSPSMANSFLSVSLSMEAINFSWFTRYYHANGASLFFIFLYLHVARGMYFSSYLYNHTWMLGVSILILTMATAFVGYVLPVNQMSYWGASVITNLFSEVPYIGPDLVLLIWGSVSVGDPTLSRFFTFHFLLPFIITALVIMHIIMLHQTGSSSPVGSTQNTTKIPFNTYFTSKDGLGLAFVISLFTCFCLMSPLMLGDDENFVTADSAMTPHHIQPEWYFLFAYAILRSIPNKLGGVIALASSVLVFYFMPFSAMTMHKGTQAYPVSKITFWLFTIIVFMLTWIGACPVEIPYILTGQILTFLYFIYFILNPFVPLFWEVFTKK